MILSVPQKIYDEMVAHAVSQAPLESCGYLAGVDNTNRRNIQAFIPMTNVDKSPEHFTFDPKEQFAAVKQARQAGQELLAVYHSHPETPARLSAEDIRLFNDAKVAYVIVSLCSSPPDVRAYTVRKEGSEVHIARIEIERGIQILNGI